MSRPISISVFFAHETLIRDLLNQDDERELVGQLNSLDTLDDLSIATRASLLERAVDDYLVKNYVKSIYERINDQSLESNQLVWIDQEVSFRAPGRDSEELGVGSADRATFFAKLTSRPSIKLVGSYDVSHLLGSTEQSQHASPGRIYMLGYVRKINTEEIELEPVIIGRRKQNYY